MRQQRQQLLRRGEGTGQDRAGDTQLGDAVRIRGGHAGQPVTLGEGAGQRVGIAIGARVVDLHVVNDSGQLLELLLGFAGLTATGAAEAVEGVGQADHATLLPDGRGGLHG